MAKSNWHRRKIQSIRDVLHDRFPECFAGKGEMKPPLKVGIYFDVVGALPELGAKDLAMVLADYTNGPTYLSNVTRGTARIGLDGRPAGVVSELEAELARGRLEAFQTWLKKNERVSA